MAKSHGDLPSLLSTKPAPLHYQISLRSIMFWLSPTLWVLLALQVLSPCALYVNCTDTLPTVSYSAALFGFDRLFMFTLVCCSIVLSIVYIGTYAVGAGRHLWLSTALGSNVLLLTLGLFDEEQGSRFIRQGQVHDVLAFSYLLLVALVVVTCYDGLVRIQGQMTHRELNWLHTFHTVVHLELGLAVVTALEYKLAYSIYTNWLWNENVEALIEWVFLSIGAFLPSILSRALPDLTIELGFHSFVDQETIC